MSREEIDSTLRRRVGAAGRLVLALTCAFAAQVQANDVDSRLKSVTTLVESSSGARQVVASQVQAAYARHGEARAHLQAAQQALDDGRREDADREILLATRAMLEAVRLADPQEVTEAKRRVDFDKYVESIDSLLDAHERVGNEKNLEASVNELRDIVGGKVSRAQDLMTKDRAEEARALLDETYRAVKIAIEQLRGGETLVRTLTFADEEEEYRYEIDRNDTHRMLVTVLLEEKMRDPRINKLVNQYMAKADLLRARAESSALEGRFDEAIGLLEQATTEVVRAIRSAGIYVPG